MAWNVGEPASPLAGSRQSTMSRRNEHVQDLCLGIWSPSFRRTNVTLRAATFACQEKILYLENGFHILNILPARSRAGRKAGNLILMRKR